jgi:hypothetical protein
MNTRRRFLWLVPAAGSAWLAMPACAAPQRPLPKLEESDPSARFVGYVEDAARVDRTKYPKFKPGQDCFSCDLYRAQPPTQPWGACTLFPRQVVAGKGWCDAYRPRGAAR